MKKVDNLGRILIPKELRAKYGLNEGAEIEFLDVGEGVTVRALDPLCRICRGEISKDSELPLCDRCLAEAARSYRKRR